MGVQLAGQRQKGLWCCCCCFLGGGGGGADKRFVLMEGLGRENRIYGVLLEVARQRYMYERSSHQGL